MRLNLLLAQRILVSTLVPKVETFFTSPDKTGCKDNSGQRKNKFKCVVLFR